MYDLTEWYQVLEKSSAPTIAAAKRAADAFDIGIWELPSGNYIALRQGPSVPRGSILVASRVCAGLRWREVSGAEYERRVNRILSEI